MADNVTLPGTGATIGCDQVTDGTLGSVQVQFVKIMDGTLDGTNKAAVGANGLKVDGSAVTQPVSGTFWQTTQPVSAASLPLPSGASTSAKQPALGTAGSASSDVITVQGIASMTALKVDGSAVTQPVSVSSVPTHAVTQSGTWTVQPGNTANTTAWKVDGSAVTQPVSGTVTATLSSTTNAGATAKTTDYDTGAGTDTVTLFGVALPASGGAVAGGTATNPIRVDPTGTTTQPISGTVTANAGTGTMAISAASLPLPSGAATSAKQPALGTAGTASSDVLTVQGIASMTALKVDGSAVTQPVSGTFWQATQPVSGTVSATLTSTTNAGATAKTSDYDTGAGTDTVTMFGIALPASGGAVQGGTATNPIQVSLANTSTNSTAVKVDASGTTVPVSGTFWQSTQPVSGTVTVQQSTASSLKVDLSGTAANATAIKVDGSAATQPVSQSGTWTVQPGNTANTTPWLVQTVPGTASGWSVSSQTALTNTKVAVKSSAGNFGGYMMYNPNASAVYIQVFDVASASVTLGTTTPTYVIPLPASAGANVEFRNGITHSTAITVAVTTTATGSTAPATALVGFFLYK
jgi:phage protein U